MDTNNWRTEMPPGSRERIVNKITEALKSYVPFSGQEVLEELKKISARFEEKIYTIAMDQPDYLRKISVKMVAMESKYQNTIPNSLPLNPSGNNNSDSGASHNMQPQVHKQILSQNIRSNM
ncbi:mediator of RNA polymerase II transcription subunit 15a-like [Euphorbia lathyris]|uniref:mediator of RNA polymerase II transcription subunit 15a-like n=1 Tax=Euphorbia lathyris TaxID=212925 RepID=UPI0033143AC2